MDMRGQRFKYDAHESGASGSFAMIVVTVSDVEELNSKLASDKAKIREVGCIGLCV